MKTKSKYQSSQAADEVVDVSRGGVQGADDTTNGNNRNEEDQPSLLSVEE